MGCCCNAIYRGDDTNAFGRIFLTVNATIPDGFVVSKVEIAIGKLPLFVYENPEFPLYIELTSDMTKKLEDKNNVYMKAYDNFGRGQTCKGTIVIETRDGVIQ